jgi:hypothetical protein
VSENTAEPVPSSRSEVRYLREEAEEDVTVGDVQVGEVSFP